MVHCVDLKLGLHAKVAGQIQGQGSYFCRDVDVEPARDARRPCSEYWRVLHQERLFDNSNRE